MGIINLIAGFFLGLSVGLFAGWSGSIWSRIMDGALIIVLGFTTSAFSIVFEVLFFLNLDKTKKVENVAGQPSPKPEEKTSIPPTQPIKTITVTASVNAPKPAIEKTKEKANEKR